MKYLAAVLAAGTAFAAGETPGGAIPGGVACPDVTGFTSPVVLPSRGGRAICVSGTIPVQASTSKNLKFNFQVPANQSGVTQTFIDFIVPGRNFMQKIMGGMQNVSGTYSISGTLCRPANSTPTDVQFLTHGVGFDRYYWDFAPGYSYVDVAADYNVATFLYDRLGVGKSEKPDALNVVQAPLEVEIANVLAQNLRKGAYGGKGFNKVVGTGHSFGSLITQAITAQSPSTFDAAILTGFSTNMTGLSAFISGLNLAIASQDQPYRFSGLDAGYLVAATEISNQIGFLNFPGADPEVAFQANAQKGTTTYGELFSQGAVTMPAKGYVGPVAVVNGFEDLPFCFGNCTYPSDKGAAAIKMLYPDTKNSSTYYSENAGHGLNLQYSALDAFHWIQKFVAANNV